MKKGQEATGILPIAAKIFHKKKFRNLFFASKSESQPFAFVIRWGDWISNQPLAFENSCDHNRMPSTFVEWTFCSQSRWHFNSKFMFFQQLISFLDFKSWTFKVSTQNTNIYPFASATLCFLCFLNLNYFSLYRLVQRLKGNKVNLFQPVNFFSLQIESGKGKHLNFKNM